MHEEEGRQHGAIVCIQKLLNDPDGGVDKVLIPSKITIRHRLETYVPPTAATEPICESAVASPS